MVNFTTMLVPRSRKAVLRDPVRTRERILGAALKEFAARGFAGARVDRIALRARINKRMLYHYFGNKEGLFRAILRLRVGDRAWIEQAPADPGELLAYWFRLACQNVDWVRLIQWEALWTHTGTATEEAERRRSFERGVAQLRERQARGLLKSDVNLQEMLLAMIALTTFPVAFPQITRLVTDLAPGDPRFRAQHTRFLQQIARAFRESGSSGGVNGAGAGGEVRAAPTEMPVAGVKR